MTTELEQEFYDTFGIEPIKYILPLGQNSYWQDGSRIMQETNYKMFKIIENDLTEEDKKLVKFIYPEITAEKLLEMICILNSIYDCGFKNNTSLASKEVKYLKMEILKHCILHKEQIKTQIQQLFKD